MGWGSFNEDLQDEHDEKMADREAEQTPAEPEPPAENTNDDE
jgi:hypothetical protein